MNYLRWCEPWGGYGEYDDTGLNDRIHHWELAYEINRVNDFKFKISLEELWWPELKYLEFPYTESSPDVHTKFIHGALPFDSKELTDFKLDDDFNWYPTCGNDWNKFFLDRYQDERPLQTIKIKNSHLKNTIKESTDKIVGVHFRRGKGIDSPENLFRETHSDSNYFYVSDEYYLNTMNEIIKVNPAQRFYLSSDLDVQKLKVFYDNFDIIDYRNVMSKLDSSVDLSKKYVSKVLHKNCLKNIVDLFSLSYCNFIVMYYPSRWSAFAKSYRNINHIGWPDKFVSSSYLEAMQ